MPVWTSVQRRILRRAGLLHDIGKLAISNRILDKPGRLSDEEFRAIKTHPVHTLRILERAPCFADALEEHLDRSSGRVVDRPETPGVV